MGFDLSPVWISLKTAISATLITFFLGVAVARWMLGSRDARERRWRNRWRGLIDGLLMLPLVLPPSVVGFLLLLLFGASSPVGRLARHFGAAVVFSWPATVITATVVAFPLMYKTTLGAFEQIDDDLIQAARTLGADELRVLGQIVLPLAWPGLLAGTSLAFARALGEFGATLMLAGDIPGRTETLPVAIFFAVESGRFRLATLWTLTVVSISLALVAALHYWSYQHKSIGAALPAAGLDLSAPFEDVAPAGVPPIPGQEAFSAPQSQACGDCDGRLLSVDIEKHLPEFHLKTRFSADGPLAILGASGSGKTMTLRSIAGLETPTRGRIVLKGRALYDSEAGIDLPPRQRRVGLLFQNYALFPHLTVARNIGFGLQKTSKAARASRVIALLDRFHLRGMEQRYPHQLSGGQQQRIALARALAIEPDVVLLDEPLSALDTYLRSQMEIQLMEALGAGPGVMLYVTHNLEEAYRIADDLLVLENGHQAAFGPKERVFRWPPTRSVARVTGCKNLSRAQAGAHGLVDALDWACQLRVSQHPPSNLSHIGIRAHHLTFRDVAGLQGPAALPPGEEANTFPCWPVKAVETPFRVTLYLLLADDSDARMHYHLEAEIVKDTWLRLRDLPTPWHVELRPDRLFLMEP